MNPIGIDIGGTKMVMLAEYKGEKISKIVSTGAEYTPSDIKKEIKTFVHNLPFTPDCMGIAVPGLVENEKTVVVSDVLPKISGMDTNFLRIDHYPVYMINDVKAALIHESSFLDENTAIVVIMVGTGIAIGIKQNGQFVNGCKGWAGELGSIPIPTINGVKKLDELASGASILTKAKVDANTLHKQLEDGDEATKRIIQSAGEYLGIAIATLIHLLNPEKIVLGGGTLQYKGYFESALQVAQTFTLPELWDVCTIQKSNEAKYMVAQGARHFANINHYNTRSQSN